jgi:AraC-like DNA-binding protein
MDALARPLLHAEKDPGRGLGGYAVSDAALAALKTHPKFDEAWRHVAVSLIKQYRGTRLLNALINDRGRNAIAVLALYLHRTASPGDVRSGLTVGRMKSICADQDIASPGRIEALIMMMRAFGFVRPLPNGGDRRVRRLEPTERLIALLHERWDTVLGAMTPIFPEAGHARDALSGEIFERALVRRLGMYFLSGFRLMDDPETMGLFGQRNGGLIIAFSLATAGGPGAQLTPVPVSISALARQFGVSRVHVRKMLRDAAAAGYLVWSQSRETEILVLPPLYEGVQNFFAKAFLFMRHCASEALDECAAARETAIAHAH